MQLSIIVVFHNMRREAARTLLSLSPAYQTHVDPERYEVIAIDNGSSQPLDPDAVTAFGPNFRYAFHDTQSVSPVGALQLGAQLARGKYIAVIVDGARMASPGLVSKTLTALHLAKEPFVCSLSWHLGPDVQNRSMLQGYDQIAEDALLDQIGWPARGYRLFEIASLAQSSYPGFLGGMPSECSWLCLLRTAFADLGGYDSAFCSPGGGLMNHDLVNRAALRGTHQFIVLLGEGVFHQFHGGVATNVRPQDHPMRDFQAEYASIRGSRYKPVPIRDVMYFGTLPASAKRFVARDPK